APLQSGGCATTRLQHCARRRGDRAERRTIGCLAVASACADPRATQGREGSFPSDRPSQDPRADELADLARCAPDRDRGEPASSGACVLPPRPLAQPHLADLQALMGSAGARVAYDRRMRWMRRALVFVVCGVALALPSDAFAQVLAP